MENRFWYLSWSGEDPLVAVSVRLLIQYLFPGELRQFVKLVRSASFPFARLEVNSRRSLLLTNSDHLALLGLTQLLQLG